MSSVQIGMRECTSNRNHSEKVSQRGEVNLPDSLFQTKVIIQVQAQLYYQRQIVVIMYILCGEMDEGLHNTS